MKGISAARQENDGSEKAQKKSLKLHGEFVNGRPWGWSKEWVHNDTQIMMFTGMAVISICIAQAGSVLLRKSAFTFNPNWSSAIRLGKGSTD